jgi:hypothetical protein
MDGWLCGIKSRNYLVRTMRAIVDDDIELGVPEHMIERNRIRRIAIRIEILASIGNRTQAGSISSSPAEDTWTRPGASLRSAPRFRAAESAARVR